jgi:murein tripeptide amidase MpaA
MIKLVYSLKKNPNVQVENLCYSLSGVQVPLLTITDPSNEVFPLLKRKTIIVTARVHPGESNGSFLMEGFLKFLLSKSAKELLTRIKFKIIPMLNPDGVIIGNFRTSFGGRDLNR